jgi:hypothetical protein
MCDAIEETILFFIDIITFDSFGVFQKFVFCPFLFHPLVYIFPALPHTPSPLIHAFFARPSHTDFENSKNHHHTGLEQ